MADADDPKRPWQYFRDIWRDTLHDILINVVAVAALLGTTTSLDYVTKLLPNNAEKLFNLLSIKEMIKFGNYGLVAIFVISITFRSLSLLSIPILAAVFGVDPSQALKSWSSKFRKGTQPSDILAERYAGRFGLLPYFFSFALVIFAGLALRIGDRFACVICLVLAFSIALHAILTIYRVSKGLFGSNRYEALELIEFITKRIRPNEGEPPTRVSRIYSSRIQDLEKSIDFPEMVR